MVDNFVVDNFFCFRLEAQIFILSYHILVTSDIDIVYTKVIVRTKIYNFVVDNFFIRDCLEDQIFV
jgi:hypothetical protein